MVAAGVLVQAWAAEQLGLEPEAVERERREWAKGAEALQRVMARWVFPVEPVARAKAFAEEVSLPDGAAQGALGVPG